MASVMQQVSDAIVALLEAGEAAGTFSKAIVTERQYDTELQLEDTDVISVQVIPVASNRTRKSEGTYNRDTSFDVMVRKRFPQTDFNEAGGIERERLDEYVDLLEQIDNYLADPDNHVPDTYTDACYIEDDSGESDREITRDLGIRIPWIPDHLTKYHQFTGVVRVAYAVATSY